MDHNINTIADLLRSARFHVSDEKTMQLAVSPLLVGCNLSVKPEHWLSDRDRVDFFMEQIGVVVELKIKGTQASVRRQLERYTAHDNVAGVILVTTRRQLAFMPSNMNGKPVITIYAGGPF